MSNETDDVWWNVDSLEGPSIVLGKGFDYQGLVFLDKDNGVVVIRSPYPSTPTDENYPYPNMLELVIPLANIEKMLESK